MRSRNSCLPWLFVLAMLFLFGTVAVAIYIPMAARQSFGEPSASLNPWQRISYGYDLILNAGDLTRPNITSGSEQLFVIQPGESVYSISSRLEQTGLIRSASTFRAYLLWTGLDTVIQTGVYRLSPAQTGIEISQTLKSATLTEVSLTVLPGWRMEEIAATLPTSGLDILPEAFMVAAASPATTLDLGPARTSAEGFLYPDTYILPRVTKADQLVSILLQRFTSQISAETLATYSRHGLTLFQAVTLASILQREAMVEDEMPMIVSVFYNRLAIGMKLEADPTVQYALGFNATQGTWWTNPLSREDMQFDSPYNTYLHPGLPPGPISNPGMAALEAVAYPAQTAYYFFQARCDDSGLHNFAETFEEHKQNYCP